MYQASLDHDVEKFNEIMSKSVMLNGNDSEEAMNALKEMIPTGENDVRDISNLELKELKQKELKDEVISGINNEYGDNWTIVMQKNKKDSNYFWMLKKIDGKYYILNGDDAKDDEFLK